MSILVNEQTNVIIQGITGKQGTYHAARMLESGAKLVAGVSHGKAGREVEGVPVYDTVAEACAAHRVDASLILVPAPAVLAAAAEAIEAGVPLLVVIAEHVPVLDTMRMVAMAREKGVRIVGPNTIGVISPGRTKVGIMPGYIYSKGPVGIVSRSGTLTHEMSSNLTYRGIGQSTCVGIGGDPIVGTNFVDVLELFREDPDTKLVVMIGEIGGGAEEQAAAYLKQGYPKPVFAFIAGQTAPPEKRMGHAGAIVQGGAGTAASKMKLLEEVGVMVFPVMDQILDQAANLLSGGATQNGRN